MNEVHGNHQDGEDRHAKQTFETDSKKRRDVVLFEEYLFCYHLNGDDDLSHDDQEIA